MAAHGIHEVSLYVALATRAQRPRARPPRLRRPSTSACARRRSCRPRRSPRSATSSRSTSRCSREGATSSRSTSRAASRARRLGRQARGQLADEHGRRAAIEVVDSTAAPAAARASSRSPPPRRGARGRGRAGRRRARARGRARALQMLVRRRHARVPAPRRAHRRRAGVARRGAEDQADPHARGEITPVERVRTSSRAFERMVDYMRERHADGADAWVVQHIQAPDDAERLVERGREIFGCEPVLRVRGRARDRHPRRPGPARRRRDPARAARREPRLSGSTSARPEQPADRRRRSRRR